MTLSFGDRVLIKATPITERLGLAGLSGLAFGTSSPASTGEPFVGDTDDDFVIGVFFDERDEVVWFTADLLEPLSGIRQSGAEKSP